MSSSHFGIFVRSIGERTEQLCLESCQGSVPDENIHLLKNYFPSYNVFAKMFEIALEKNYRWILGVDADLVLRKNWFGIAEQVIQKLNNGPDIFRFHFYVHDKFTPHPGRVIQGNNFYNGKFLEKAYKELRKNIRLSRLGFLNKFFTHYPAFYLKPETTIRKRMYDKYGIDLHKEDEQIGWHGFEQYHADIFHRWVVRSNRNPEFIEMYPYLDLKKREDLRGMPNQEWLTANLGWEYGMAHRLSVIDGRDRNKYSLHLEQSGIAEKSPLAMTLEDFYRHYENYKNPFPALSPC